MINSAKSAVESLGTRASSARDAGKRDDLGVVAGDFGGAGGLGAGDLSGDFNGLEMLMPLVPIEIAEGRRPLLSDMRVSLASVAPEDDREREWPSVLLRGKRGRTGLSTERGD